MTRARWKARWSSIVLVAWLGLGAAAPLLVGELPLLARVNGVWGSPAARAAWDRPVSARPPAGWQSWAEWHGHAEGAIAWFPLCGLSPSRPGFDRMLLGPSLDHPLGTDGSGRDLLARTLHALGRAAWVGIGTALLAIALGVLLGGASGWIGGWPGRLMQWWLDWSVGVPPLLVAMCAIGFLGFSGPLGLIGLLGLLAAGGVARLVRGEVAHQRRQAYVAAAEGLGVPRARVLCLHLLSNLRGLMAVQAALVLSAAILAESTLAFLGLAGAEAISLGGMLAEARETMHVAWHPFVPPAVAMILIVLSCHAYADRLGDGDRGA